LGKPAPGHHFVFDLQIAALTLSQVRSMRTLRARAKCSPSQSHELRSFLRGPQCPYLTRGRIHRRRPNRIERDMPVRWCPKIRANGATYNWGPNNNHLEQNPNCQSNWPDRCSSWEFCIGRDGFCPIGQRWSVPSRWRRRLPRLTRSPR